MRNLVIGLGLCVALGCQVTGNLGGDDGGDPRCSPENLRVMTHSCGVDFFGSPSACALVAPPVPAGYDWSPSDVALCNAKRHGGATAECIAGMKSQCDAARDAGDVSAVFPAFAPCLSGGGTSSQSCDDQCTAAYATCDDRCTGGQPCKACRSQGGPNADCAGSCLDAGFETCVDCSLQCGLAYAHCINACP